ncbi:MAG: TetR/AcrR family transcriptional regulator [candidate division NC10 bacterium]|nr:TetR/AcrR family transcriptional regulator [candidate division NC10 bacterium]
MPRREGPLKRKRIIASALKAFSEKGYHQARISEIAEEALVAKGTIYLYFRNKEELFLASLDDVAREFLSQLSQELDRAGDALARLKRIIHFHLTFLDKNVEIFSILERELPADLSRKLRAGAKQKQRLEAYLETMEKILLQGQREGQLEPPGGPAFAAQALWGILHAVGHQRLSERDRRPVDEVARDVIHQFFYGVCRERKP